MLFMQARQEYGPENIELLGVMEQTALENDLRAIARQQSFNFRTSDDVADEKIQGQFGVGRPRQAGSPYESPPTPRVVPRALDPRPQTVGGILVRDPEAVRDMTATEAIVESLKPQTIRTATEMQEEKDAQAASSIGYLTDVNTRARSDEYAGIDFLKLSGVARQNVIDQVIRDDFADYEKRLRAELSADYKRRYLINTGQEAPQETVDSFVNNTVYPEMRNAIAQQLPVGNPMVG